MSTNVEKLNNYIRSPWFWEALLFIMLIILQSFMGLILDYLNKYAAGKIIKDREEVCILRERQEKNQRRLEAENRRRASMGLPVLNELGSPRSSHATSPVASSPMAAGQLEEGLEPTAKDGTFFIHQSTQSILVAQRFYFLHFF